MTVIASICERWSMQLEKPPPDQPWFLDWVLRSPKEVSGHLTAGYLAYSSVLKLWGQSDFSTAREYFGGMGAQALMIQELFALQGEHTVLDYSDHAVDHLTRVLPPHIRAIVADSYDPSFSEPADIVGLDFGDMTCWRLREGEPHRQLLERVVALEPRAFVITDIAGPRLHLQRERYEGLLGRGTCATYELYLNALMYLIEEITGYTLVEGYFHRWSTVMAFTHPSRAELAPGTIRPVAEQPGPLGLELL